MKIGCLLAVIVPFFIAPQAASAAAAVATYTGTITSGSDPLGLLGVGTNGSLAGKSFSMSVYYDTNGLVYTGTSYRYTITGVSSDVLVGGSIINLTPVSGGTTFIQAYNEPNGSSSSALNFSQGYQFYSYIATPLGTTLTDNASYSTSQILSTDLEISEKDNTGRYNQVAAGRISSASVSILASAVPEPASWAIMIAGFGMTGIALRRRQRLVLRNA